MMNHFGIVGCATCCTRGFDKVVTQKSAWAKNDICPPYQYLLAIPAKAGIQIRKDVYENCHHINGRNTG